jgi:hypothetical protein
MPTAEQPTFHGELTAAFEKQASVSRGGLPEALQRLLLEPGSSLPVPRRPRRLGLGRRQR